MGIDHSNPYIHSTTVLCDPRGFLNPSQEMSQEAKVHTHIVPLGHTQITTPTYEELCGACTGIADHAWSVLVNTGHTTLSCH